MAQYINVTQMTDEEAVWRTYQKYDFVEVNQFGEIRTKDRTIMRKNGVKQFIKGHILKQHPNEKGYMTVEFSVNGKNIVLKVHRAVAICFCPNPNNYPEVNHIDNNRTNNSASNLEWCTRQYNIDYKNNFGTSSADVQGRPVIAVNQETGKVLLFKSQGEAAHQLDVYQSNIWKVINGKRNKAGGYWFCNTDETAVEKTRAKFGDEIAREVEKILNDVI